MKKIILLFVLNISFLAKAQYTEIINSNNPGKSMGAYAVGRKVVQVESEFFYESSKHDRLGYSQNSYGVNYELRYGVWKDRFEAILDGTLLYDNLENIKTQQSQNKFGFQYNSLGAKFLFYDPVFLDYVNVHSWNANAKFSWKKLIPAVSLYLGANFFEKNRYLYEIKNEDFRTITPKAIISLQSHPTNEVVLVVNFIGQNMLSTKHRQLSYVATLTHNLYDDRWSIFIENEGVTSDYYKDSLIRLGASYLISEAFQINAFLGASAKTTPTRYTAALGLSYRIYDRYKDVEYIEKLKARDKQFQEDSKIFGF